jgi:RNA polymerase sigma-70 factor, ECF subfamily
MVWRNFALQTSTGVDVLEFERLYQENLSPIYRYVYSQVKNRQEAEDLTSHVFLKAVRGFDITRSVQTGRPWLMQIARTTIADYWRVHYRVVINSLDDLLEADWEGPPDPAGVDSFVESSNVEERVQGILNALPERYREVLTCRFLLNLSIRETAEKMGLTEANVKVMQYRALKRAAELDDFSTESTV